MKRTLSYQTYLDKVHGGWIGKCIGGAVGARMENNKEMMDFTFENVYPEKVPFNDDLDIQLLWLEVLQKKGSNITSRDMADAWLKSVWYAPNEYGYFNKNYRLGIAPPVSGIFNNQFFKNSMGCPIRSEIWGFVCPGEPVVAVQYAYKDGTLDHDMLSVYAEQFFAALEAEVFFEDDLFDLMQKGLVYVPEETDLYKCIQLVIDLYKAGRTWQETRVQILLKFSSPDASYSVQNIGLTVLALIFGKGNFTDTMLIAVNSGYDTDCTAATAGAILGQILGGKRIPREWLERIGDELVVGIYLDNPASLITQLAEDTCKVGLSFKRDGLLSVEITDIPADIVASLPLPIKNQEQELEINYVGLPSIGVDSPANVKITLMNRSDCEQSGILLIKTPDYIKASVLNTNVAVMKNGRMELPVTFSISGQTEILPQKNLITLQWMDGEKVLAEHTFGLSGAYRVKVIGPFWDTYDSDKYGQNPYLNKRPEGRFHFNNYVSLKHNYIDESFKDIDAMEGTWCDFHEDKLTLNELFTHNGQSCVYIVHDVISPEDREIKVNIGNNDGYRFWANGELKYEETGHNMWMPFNSQIPVNFKKGVNRLIFKIIRTDSNYEFSYGFKGDDAGLVIPSHSKPDSWFVDLASKI